MIYGRFVFLPHNVTLIPSDPSLTFYFVSKFVVTVPKRTTPTDLISSYRPTTARTFSEGEETREIACGNWVQTQVVSPLPEGCRTR